MVRDKKFCAMRRASAFTLVEIMIVVAVIALLAALALPSLLHARRRSQNTLFINEMRIATNAFALYAQENNSYPPNTSPGILPPGMSGYFGATFDFSAPTPIGGNWDWANRKTGNVIGVSVVNPTCDITQLQEIDAMMDDGNLATGGFFEVAANRYISVLE